VRGEGLLTSNWGGPGSSSAVKGGETKVRGNWVCGGGGGGLQMGSRQI